MQPSVPGGVFTSVLLCCYYLLVVVFFCAFSNISVNAIVLVVLA